MIGDGLEHRFPSGEVRLACFLLKDALFNFDYQRNQVHPRSSSKGGKV